MSDRLPPTMDVQDLINATPNEIMDNDHSRNMFKLFILVRHRRNETYNRIQLFERCMKIQNMVIELEEQFNLLTRHCSVEQNRLLSNACPNQDIWINQNLTQALEELRAELSNFLVSCDEMEQFRNFILNNQVINI